MGIRGPVNCCVLVTIGLNAKQSTRGQSRHTRHCGISHSPVSCPDASVIDEQRALIAFARMFSKSDRASAVRRISPFRWVAFARQSSTTVSVSRVCALSGASFLSKVRRRGSLFGFWPRRGQRRAIFGICQYAPSICNKSRRNARQQETWDKKCSPNMERTAPKHATASPSSSLYCWQTSFGCKSVPRTPNAAQVERREKMRARTAVSYRLFVV